MPAVSKKQQRYFGYLLSNPEERKKKGISKKAAKDFAQDIQEVSPPGWGHTKAEKEKTKPNKPKSKIGGSAAAFKRALDDGRFKGLPGSTTKKEKTADMFKLMWSMKKKGDKPHYKPGTDKKYKKYQEESTMPNVDVKDRKAIKSRAKNLFKRDLKGEHQGVNEEMRKKRDVTKSKPKAPQFNAAKELVTDAPYMKPALQQREGVSYKDFTKTAQAAMDRIKKAKEEKLKKNAESARKDRVEKGVRFYDKKGKGYIKKGKKVYT